MTADALVTPKSKLNPWYGRAGTVRRVIERTFRREGRVDEMLIIEIKDSHGKVMAVLCEPSEQWMPANGARV